MNVALPLSLEFVWFVSTVLLVIGLRRMSSPKRARSGIYWAGVGMLLAVMASFGHPGIAQNLVLILVALAIGGVWSYLPARRVAMKDMPQMIALYNALGGGAAACIAVLALLHPEKQASLLTLLSVVSGLIGGVAMSGSLTAFLRLRGTLKRQMRFANRQVAYLCAGAMMLLLGLILAASSTAHPVLLVLFLVAAVLFGFLMTLPIAVTDMPVLISLFNAMTGLAVSFDGYMLGNPAMMVAGMIVFAAGALLTRKMARSGNRRLSEIMYSGFGIMMDDRTELIPREQVQTVNAVDAAVGMAYATRVIIVPGYGMAQAQAQHKLRELTQLLDERGVQTGFAIHPVAGRMPGHMNVMLAEAGVPYESIFELDQINPEFPQVDVVLVVGASDIVNPSARDDKDSPLYGMSILDVDKAGRVIVLKRGDGSGYAGVDNPLLFAPGTRVIFGDARESVQRLIDAVKFLDV